MSVKNDTRAERDPPPSHHTPDGTVGDTTLHESEHAQHAATNSSHDTHREHENKSSDTAHAPHVRNAHNDSEKSSDNTADLRPLQDKIRNLQNDLDQREQKITELEDRYVRTLADTDNYKKRLQREKQETLYYANKGLLLDILAILDNFERAIQSDGGDDESGQFRNGIALIHQEWVKLLKDKWEVTVVESLGKQFDPNIHEAVAMEEMTDCAEQKVGEVYQKGYFFRDRLLRPARVKVITPVDAGNRQE